MKKALVILPFLALASCGFVNDISTSKIVLDENSDCLVYNSDTYKIENITLNTTNETRYIVYAPILKSAVIYCYNPYTNHTFAESYDSVELLGNRLISVSFKDLSSSDICTIMFIENTNFEKDKLIDLTPYLSRNLYIVSAPFNAVSKLTAKVYFNLGTNVVNLIDKVSAKTVQDAINLISSNTTTSSENTTTSIDSLSNITL